MSKIVQIFLAICVLCIGLMAENSASYPFVCKEKEIEQYADFRFLAIGKTQDGGFPNISIDTQTIKIDRQSKIIEVWVLKFASEKGRNTMIESMNSRYSDFGYSKELTIFNYGKMHSGIKEVQNFRCDGSVIQSEDTLTPKMRNIAPYSMRDLIIQELMKKYKLN